MENYNDIYSSQILTNYIQNDIINQQNKKKRIFYVTKNPKYTDKKIPMKI